MTVPRDFEQRRVEIADLLRSLTPEQARTGIGRQYAHDGPLEPGLDYTVEAGNLVFSAWYLFKRGTCCESGCRHCPYGFAPG
ncbi:MAG: DUF5522 domain-containing protein [Planctomycetota bacterium]